MIRIENISKGNANEALVGVSTKYGRTTNQPLMIKLSPGSFIDMPRLSFHQFHYAVKEHIAEYVAHAILRVLELSSSHKYQDKGNKSQYTNDYIIATPDELALSHALEVAVDLDAAMNFHYSSQMWHTASTAAIAVVAPTNLATLLLWIAAAQTAYTAHRTSAAAHPFIDTNNVLALGAPANLAQAVLALRELHGAYESHRVWITNSVELDIPGVLAY
jgi:hypothetical protein